METTKWIWASGFNLEDEIMLWAPSHARCVHQPQKVILRREWRKSKQGRKCAHCSIHSSTPSYNRFMGVALIAWLGLTSPMFSISLIFWKFIYLSCLITRFKRTETDLGKRWFLFFQKSRENARERGGVRLPSSLTGWLSDELLELLLDGATIASKKFPFRQ